MSIDDVFIRVRGSVGSLGTYILHPDLPVIVLFSPTKDKLKECPHLIWLMKGAGPGCEEAL